MKTWPFWVDLLVWCLLIMLVWVVITMLALAAIQKPDPPPFPGDVAKIARSPRDAAAQAKLVVIPMPVTNTISAYFAPTVLPGLTAFFQVSSNLTDWSTISSVPYPNDGGTLQCNYTNFGGYAFFRAGYSGYQSQ